MPPSYKVRLNHITAQLTQQFDTKVIMKADAQKQGEIKILFDSEEELNRIAAMISNTN